MTRPSLSIPIQGTVGHEIDYWMRYYVDTGEPVPDDPTQRRPCARCGQPPTERGDDPCIANLPGVAYACCGHGGVGYVAFGDGRRVGFVNRTGEDIRAMVMRVVIDGTGLPPGWQWDRPG